MAISVRQFELVYSKFFERFIKEGEIPSFQDVVNAAGSELPSATDIDEPIYKYMPQVGSSLFDMVLFNKLIQHIAMDLGLLFEEVSDVQRKNIERVLNADLFHNVHSYELKRLENQLDSLLFTLQGADDNFFAAFDNFIDLTKTDTTKSTPGIVDINENLLALPLGLSGSSKISLDHLFALTSPSDLTVSRIDVNSLGEIPSTVFGNIFSDSTNAWGIIYESDSNGELEMRFTFRLKREEFINRITAIHHGEKPQRLTVRTSVDNINIKDIDTYSDGILLSDQSQVISLDFSDRLVDYVHIALKKTEADDFIETNSGGRKYIYRFGLKNIGIFVTGREKEGSYFSKPFDFSEDLSTIGQVAISADEIIPDNTRVDWYIAGIDDDDERVGEYIPISPQSRNVDTGINKVVRLQDVLTNEKGIVSDATNVVKIETAQNIDFYQIASLPSEPVFGTAALFRGYKAWSRDASQAVNPILIKDNFIPFSKGDTQTIYVVTTEVLQPSQVNVNSDTQIVIVTSQPPLYNPSRGHFRIPPPEINPEQDSAPTYAIYSALLNLEELVTIQENVTFENGVENRDPVTNQLISKTIDLGSKIIKYKVPGDIEIRKQPTAGEQLYIDGTDYIVRLDSSGFPTGEIIGVHLDFLSATYESSPGVFEWMPLKITFNLDPDITRHVQDINGFQVFFSLPQDSFPIDTSIVIRYRHPAVDVLKASVKVKNTYGVAGESNIFIQGQDYIFDGTNSTIQRLSTGAISSQQDVYVDFKYNSIGNNLEQFFIWAQATDPNGTNVSVEKSGAISQSNNLTPDTELGEEFLASIEGVGLVNLTLATEWPELIGFTQFVVKSKNPDIYPDALINQIIKMKDEQGQYIFKMDGKYFEDLIGKREPLTQVSYNYLKTNVKKNDDQFFAIRDVFLGGSTDYQVVINFEPSASEKFYRFTADHNEQTGLKPLDEEWKIKWVSKEANAQSFKKIVVRADLLRIVESGNNVTPKVKSYFLKVGY
jgi:hypothetical protein